MVCVCVRVPHFSLTNLFVFPTSTTTFYWVNTFKKSEFAVVFIFVSSQSVPLTVEFNHSLYLKLSIFDRWSDGLAHMTVC